VPNAPFQVGKGSAMEGMHAYVCCAFRDATTQMRVNNRFSVCLCRYNYVGEFQDTKAQISNAFVIRDHFVRAVRCCRLYCTSRENTRHGRVDHPAEVAIPQSLRS
jgi:hypothetical protein